KHRIHPPLHLWLRALPPMRRLCYAYWRLAMCGDCMGTKWRDDGTRYHITVKEFLDISWSTWFNDLTITHDTDGMSMLVGSIRDQSALYGLIDNAITDSNTQKESMMTPLPTTMHIPSAPWRLGRRVLRGIGRTLAVLFALSAILALAGASYEAIAATGDARHYPAPGQLVEIGRAHV